MTIQDRRRRPTMADVAQAAGVSVMTVSYAYSKPDRVAPETAERVHAAAAALGYPGPHPGARSLRRGRTGTLGVVLGERLTYAFEDLQAARFLAGVAEVCAESAAGLTLVPITGADDDIARVLGAAVDAFVVWTTADDDPVLDAVVGTGLPAVVHGGPERPGLPVVTIDNRAAARAVGEVAFAGARRPAVLSCPLDRARHRGTATGVDPAAATFPITRQRLEGYRDAWAATGGDWADVHVAVCAINRAGEGESAAEGLLAVARPPDTIAAMSDELALGALRAAARAGVSVPGQLAVTGWDDTDLAAEAGLTTVHQSLRAQGMTCARLALGRLAPGRLADEPWHVVRRRTHRSAR